MKITGKGIIAIMGFFILLPLVVDLITGIWVPKNPGGSMSLFLVSSYIRFLPLYLIYLAIALFIIYLFNRYKKHVGRNPDDVKE
jgi:hypothetical protein